MSKLDELIVELCPDGVEYKTLEELGTFFSGLKGKKKEDFSKGNKKFISYKNVFDNPEVNLKLKDYVNVKSNETQNIIKKGDVLFTGSSETLDEVAFSSVVTVIPQEDIYLNSFCFGFRPFSNTFFNPHFLKHLFRSESIRKQLIKTGQGVTRYNVSKTRMKKVKIPIPPLEIQTEIARTLDSFTELTASLEKEREARLKQYEYYRDLLLTFEDDKDLPLSDEEKKILIGWRNKKVNFIKLEYIVDRISSGKCKEKFDLGPYPVYGSTGIIGYTDDCAYHGLNLLVARVGVNAGYVQLVDGCCNVSDNTLIIESKAKTTLQFLRYYFDKIKLNRFTKGGGQPLLTATQLKELTIPMPELRVQEKIVSILDRFEALCNDLSDGLPAEIEARRKQYEYYRDLLLTFEPADASSLQTDRQTS